MSGFFCISGGINAHANTETEAGNQGDSSASRLHAPRLLRVAVGSGNPSKIKAIERMLERALQRHQCCKPKNDSIQRDPSLQNGETSEKVNDLLTSHQADLFACFKLDVQGFEVESGVPHQPFGDGETKLGARNRSRNAAKAYKAANNGILPHLAIGMEGGLEWHGIVEKSSQSTTLLISSSSRNASDSASNDGGALRSSKNGREASAYPVSTTKELYCMAWMAIYGRRTGFVVDVLAAPDTRTYVGDKKAIFGFAKTASFALPREIVRLVVEEKLELGDADDRVFQRVKSKHGGGTVGILTNHMIDRSEYYEHALQLALIPWIRPEMYPEGTS